MTRPNDVGGITGFGVVGERDELSPFGAEWQRTICGLVMGYSATGRANEADIRDAVDRMAPPEYMAASSWERWVTGLASIVVEQGQVSAAELDAELGGSFLLSNPPVDLDHTAALFGPERSSRPALPPGTAVTVRNWHPRGHTRCPRYAQGRSGVVVRRNATHSLPDLAVATGEEREEHTYCVRFEASTLWGETAPQREAVHLDLYESYLEVQP